MFTQTQTAYATIRQAIVDRLQIQCVYNGRIRYCCPHAIGTKGGVQHVLMFQFAGESKSGLPPSGCWRCLDVHELSAVSSRPGAWFARNDHSQRQTCIDVVDIDVTMC